MSVVEWDVIGSGREGEKNAQFARTYTRIFRAVTDASTDSADTVLAYSEVPVPALDVYPGDTTAYCISSHARQEVEDDHKCWLVTSRYSTVPPNNPGSLDTNPLLDAPLLSFQSDTFTQVAREGIRYDTATGNSQQQTQPGPLRNSVGEVFRPGVEMDFCRGVFVVRRNVAYVDPSVLTIVNCVNAVPWRSCPARTVKCRSVVSGDVQQRNNISYYSVSGEFHFDPRTWDVFVLNQASKYKNSAGKWIQLEPGTDKVTIYTDEAGLVAGQKVASTANPTVQQIYRRYRVYPEVNFSTFGF